MTMNHKTSQQRPHTWWRVGLACLCLALAACGARVDLMGSIPEDEANDVLAALLKENISAEKSAGKEGMVGVRVNSDQVGRALEILRDNGLRMRHGADALFHGIRNRPQRLHRDPDSQRPGPRL